MHHKTPSNLSQESFSVSRRQKETLNGHRALTLWLTGLSAAGKSTIARYLEELLHRNGIRTLMLDGDNTRIGINKDLDFSPQGRQENIRRVAEIAKLVNEAGVVAIACFISPMRSDREMAKQVIGSDSFIEVFIDAPLETCIERDPKGLYKKALRGEIGEFTGISAPYEAPLQPQLHIVTVDMGPSASAQEIWQWLSLEKKLAIQQAG
jgi:adenylyl-sulfate kinase